MLRKVNSVVSCQLSVVRKEIFLCIFSAVPLILSFPGFNLEFLAWVAFIPLFFALRGKTKIQAFWLSYLTGLIFWLGTIYWLIHVTLLGTILLVLYLAVYFGIFGLIVSTMNYKLRTMNLIYISSVWVILEYLRSYLLTGFPWALLGYSQFLNLPVMQIADITGAWGVSFLVMTVNAGAYSVVSCPCLAGRQELLVVRKRWEQVLIPLVLIISSLGYGYYKLYHRPSPPAGRAGTIDHRPIKISVIQGNIPQELKWDSFSADFIMNRYFGLTAQAAKDNPDLIVWPEAALPAVLEEDPRYFKEVCDFAAKINPPLLLGAVTFENNNYFNSALLVSSAGKLPEARYNKIHRVPFGEYIPLKSVFKFLETVTPIGDLAAGSEYTVFEIPDSAARISGLANHSGEKFSVLICFEDLFPELSRRFVNKGAGFLVNITNDAWYKKSPAAEQHLQASVFRAVENRIFLVRSANTGVSGFIAPSGKIISLVSDKHGNNIFVPGYKTELVFSAAKNNPGFYSRYGDIFAHGCFFLGLVSAVISLRKKA